jgi:hypothetical protein
MIEILTILPLPRNSKQLFEITYVENYKEEKFKGSQKEIQKMFNLEKPQFNIILRESLETEVD